MSDYPISPDGSASFVLGMNGYIPPDKLTEGEYAMGMNLICRGGIAQTRPGSVSLPFEVPGSNLQGLTLFTPTAGVPYLVFVSDGLVYYSASPFKTYAQFPDLKFSKYTKFIAWAKCVQSTYYNEIGELVYLESPRAVLMMQDGSTRAAYWDGTTARHLNPTPSEGTITEDGRDETPVGLWMAWSNNRLWLSRRDRVFASDIGNPLKFTETQYIAEGRAFYLPGVCTGVVETADRSGVICFTQNTGTLLLTSIQDRSLWLNTPSFQQTIFPTIGCIAPRSIVQQYGLIWWWTQSGLVNQNNALQANISSRVDLQDNEMIQSKSNLSYDLQAVCGEHFENFLVHGVPNGDKINTRVHVLDQAPFEGNTNTWPSYWTGWRPVEFASGVITSQERIFLLSYDYDGKNRIWEIFRNEKSDNGIPITSFVATRDHYWQNRDYKDFAYAEIEMVNISGPTAVMVAAAGIRGAYQPMMRKDISASQGQVYWGSLYGEEANEIGGSRWQTRVVRTIDDHNPSACNEACIESELRGLTDKGFSILIVWSGIAGISAYRIFSRSNPQPYQGTCEENETDEDRLLTTDGCSARDPFSISTPFDRYYAQATFCKVDPVSGDPVTKTIIQDSLINQEDADRKATATAEWYVLQQIGELV